MTKFVSRDEARTSFWDINAINCKYISKCDSQIVGRRRFEARRCEGTSRASEGNCDENVGEHFLGN